MTKAEHLWVIGYDGMERAEQVRDEIVRLGWDTPYFTLLDVANATTLARDCAMRTNDLQYRPR
jgi:hypothetical protein